MFPDLGVERFFPFQKNEFIDDKAVAQWPLYPVVGTALLLPRFHVPAVLIPEIGRQLPHAGEQKIGVLQDFVVEIVFRRKTKCTRLDAHVDVLADQDHLPFGMSFLQVLYHTDDLIVCLAGCQPGRQFSGDGFSLKKQPAGSLFCSGIVQ